MTYKDRHPMDLCHPVVITHMMNACMRTTGWWRCIGCLKLQVIFGKRATDYRALLQKRPMKMRHPKRLRHPVIYMCAWTHIWSINMCLYIMIYMYDQYMCVSIYHHYRCVFGPLGIPGSVWLRLVGSLKLQVSFAKEPYKGDDILQKRPIILRSLLIVATP